RGADLTIHILHALPQGEVAGVGLLILIGIDAARARGKAGTGAGRLRLYAGQPTVRRERRDVEVHGAVTGTVRMAPLDEAADDVDHLGDVLSGARIDVRRAHGERREIGEERVHHRAGDVANG